VVFLSLYRQVLEEYLKINCFLPDTFQIIIH
jgi:hypothetical protein